MKQFLLLVLSFIFIFSCAGRTPILIDKKTDADQNLECAALITEIDKYTELVVDRYHKGKNATSTAITLGVISYILFPPLALAMDISGADYKEMGAYQSRRNYLIKLGTEKKCVWVSDVMDDKELMTFSEKEHKLKVKENVDKKP